MQKESSFRSFLARNSYLVTLGMAILSIILALVIAGIVIAAIGISPLEAYKSFFGGIFAKNGFGQMLNKFTPLVCCALGFSIAVKSGFFNIGAEGQFNMGVVIAFLVALHCGNLPPVLAIIVSILAGMAGGAILSGIAGLLKITVGASELLTTLMLNYIMTNFMQMGLETFLKSPTSQMSITAPIADSAKLPMLVAPMRLHSGLIIAIIAVLVVWFFHQRTVVGFEMRLSGINPKAATYAGANQRRSLIIVIILSGALAGLGGSLELLGNQYKIVAGISSGYGFDAIGVAVMGQHTPAGIVLAALLFAMLRVGAEAMQRSCNVPLPLLSILQGVIVVMIIVSNFWVNKIKTSLVEGRA